MSFGQPLLLLTLLVLPLAVGLYVVAERRRMRYAVRFTNLDTLSSVARGRRSWRRYVAPVVFLLALAGVCAATARPQVSALVPARGATVILVIDVSSSMRANDVEPTRLGAAEEAVRTFLDHAPRLLRTGLIAFAAEPQVATPPTTDHALMRESVETLDQFGGLGGTAIGDALAEAVRLSSDAVRPAPPDAGHGQHGGLSRLASIVFLSDGAQTQGRLQPQQGASLARAARIPVYTVALGKPNGTLTLTAGARDAGFSRVPVPPDPETMHAIAETTQGTFVDAEDAKTLRAAYASLASHLGREPGTSEITNEFVLAAAGLLLAAGLLSALWSPRFP
jgi:Ca-activated chloride channel homolog